MHLGLHNKMDGQPLANSLLAVIPDVLWSLNHFMEIVTVPGKKAATKDTEYDGELALLKALREAVHAVQNALDPAREDTCGERLKPLYDAVECCRLLASALFLDPSGGEGQNVAVPCVFFSSRSGVEITRIARRIVEAIHFLCEDNVA